MMETHIAKRKDHRCDACGRRIPIGKRYFVGDDNSREHTNCCDFTNEKELPPGYNQKRGASRRGEPYFDDKTGTANGFDSVWQRFMDRVVAEGKVERFHERDLRAKAATGADDIVHAQALLDHSSSSATTRRVYRRKPEGVKPGKVKG